MPPPLPPSTTTHTPIPSPPAPHAVTGRISQDEFPYVAPPTSPAMGGPTGSGGSSDATSSKAPSFSSVRSMRSAGAGWARKAVSGGPGAAALETKPEGKVGEHGCGCRRVSFECGGHRVWDGVCVRARVCMCFGG
jgi:hypothetical protein